MRHPPKISICVISPSVPWEGILVLTFTAATVHVFDLTGARFSKEIAVAHGSHDSRVLPGLPSGTETNEGEVGSPARKVD